MEALQQRPPIAGLLLAYGAMLPLAGGAIATLLMPGIFYAFLYRFCIIWAGCLLCFFAGVNRGLSFRDQDGPPISQLLVMLWLFVLGIAGLIVPYRQVSIGLLLAGFASMAVIDPLMARANKAPRYFAHLRPIQLGMPLASLLILLITER